MPGPTTSFENRVRVIECHKLGLKTVEIVRQTGVKRRTVERLVKSFKESGGREVPTKKKNPGKPPMVSNRTLAVLKREAELHPSHSARQFKEDNPVILDKPSVRTVQTYLSKRLGFKRVTTKIKNRILPSHKVQRKEFFAKYGDWSVDQWKRVMFTDEATFHCSAANHSKVWRSPNANKLDSKFLRQRDKWPNTIQVWGSMGYGGVGELVLFEKNTRVDQYLYYLMLDQHLQPSLEKTGCSIFQQDGARCHTTGLIFNLFDELGVEILEKWPANSPDLSPIENLWAILKFRLQKTDVSTPEKLIAALRQEWEKIPAEICQHLIESVPRRLQGAKKNKFLHTKY